MPYFLDTSALFKQYIKEQGTELVRKLFSSGESLVISNLSIVEAVSNLRRLVDVDGLIDEEVFRRTTAMLFDDIDKGLLEVIEVTMATVIQGAELISKKYMKPVDAIQLAVALSLQDRDLVFVCSDRNLCKRVAEEGLQILDPTVR